MSEQEAVAGVGILVAAFTEEKAGDEALKVLKQARARRQVYFEEAAVIRQGADGDVHYRETGDMTTGRGAGAGALIGGLIGILGGPAGIVVGAGAGALVGGLAAKGDAGFDDKSLEQLGSALKPGTSAVALVTSSAFLHEARNRVNDAEMRTALAKVGAELAARLGEGKNVALGLVLTEAGLAVKEVAADDKSAEVIGLVVTEDGVIGGAAVATEEGAAYKVAAVTEDAAAVEAGVVTEEGAVIAGAAATEDEAVAGGVVLTPEEENGEDEK